MASLQVSYDAHLKQCILCFSIYLDDHKIEAEQLIRWSVGEGFVRGNGTETARELAFNWLKLLKEDTLMQDA